MIRRNTMIYKPAERAGSVSPSATTQAGKTLVIAVQDQENQPLNSDIVSPPTATPNTPTLASASSSNRRNPLFFNERGLRAGWRLLIYIVLLFVLITILSTILRPFR